jgi:hypothetical protein
MNKTIIGLLFILAGVTYGSTAVDSIYNRTLGWLVQNQWISPPKAGKKDKSPFGRKGTIILYSLALIIIGIFILWNRNN